MLTPLSWAVLAFFYYPGIVANENLSPDADSSAIPIGGAVITAIVLLLIMLPITWLCVRRTEPPGTLFAWRGDRPVLSALVSVVLIGLAATVLVGALWDYVTRPLPWYEYMTLPTPLLLAVWLLGLRGAVLSTKQARQVKAPTA